MTTLPGSTLPGSTSTGSGENNHETGSRRRIGVLAAVSLVIVVGAALAGCGGGNDAAYGTLPPIITTTTIVPTTAVGDGKTKYYEVKPGDSLASIAAAFHVPLAKLKELNAAQMPNPDNLYVGTLLQIPTDVIVIDELPSPNATPVSSVTPSSTP